jgi:hypothetical protein
MWEKARCQDVNREVFYGVLDELTGEVTLDALAAKEYCRSCPVAHKCIDHSVRHNETLGIWGVGGARRRMLRRIWISAQVGIRTEDEYLEAVDREVRILRGTFERPFTPRRACERCKLSGLSSHIPAGRHPEDCNGPAARCGLPSTYARGCRCWYCGFARAARVPGPRRPAPPREEVPCLIAAL